MKFVKLIKAYHKPFYSDKNFWQNILDELNANLTQFSKNERYNRETIYISDLKLGNIDNGYEIYYNVKISYGFIHIDWERQGTIGKPYFSYNMTFEYLDAENEEQEKDFSVSYRDEFPKTAQELKESIQYSIENVE